MEIVQQRNASTLLPIINAHVAPSTVIHTDKWQHTTVYHHCQMCRRTPL